MTASAAAQHWDERYSESDRIWTGNPNAALVEIVAPLPAATVLDLGCGEGGDAVWLAGQGWQVTATDVSQVAIGRAAAHARAAGVAGRITFVQGDLATGLPLGPFELVSAQFLQSVIEFPRADVLRAAAAAVAAGGLLLVVEHGSVPPWSGHAHAHHLIPVLAETLAGLALDPDEWTVERADQRPRDITGPDGATATILDNVIAARRAGVTRRGA